MENKQLKPLGDRVLVKEITSQEERKTSTGIIIPETVTANDVKIGEVIAVGDGLYTQNGVSIPMSVKVGDEVVLPPYGNGQTIKIAKVEYVLYRESDLLGVFKSLETDSQLKLEL
jgi:chaperonin GroES